MATEQWLISAQPIANGIALYVAENAYLNDTALDVLTMVAKWLDDAPTIEASPVVHGRWLIDEYEYYDCSVCGQSYFNGCDSRQEAEDRLKNHPYDVYSYCPYCGAKMDGGADNG